MFPHARNSLRSGGESQQPGQSKIPIPIGVSLINAMAVVASPESVVDSNVEGIDKHSANLDSNDEGDNPQEASLPHSPQHAKSYEPERNLLATSSFQGERSWFRAQHEQTLLPSLRLEVWADVPDLGGAASEDEGNTGSKTMNQRVYSGPSTIQSVQPSWEHLDERLELPDEWWMQDGLYPTLRLRIVQEEPPSQLEFKRTTQVSPSIVVLELPMYPPKLERLRTQDIPESLPPNACLIHFSDGSTRISPTLFECLLESNQVASDGQDVVEDFSRFEDDVFRTLDGVPHTPNRPRAPSASALLEPSAQQASSELANHPISQLQEPDDVDANLMAEFDETSSNESKTKPSEQHDQETDGSIDVAFADDMEGIQRKDMEEECRRLELMIAQEEELLGDESKSLQDERESLFAMLQEAKDLDRHIQLVRAETKNQELELQREDFSKHAQHMKLLRELQTIYPIALDSQKGYLIRSLRLPVDIYTTTVPEDEISAALGFTCHLVAMVSKYLGTPLRYQLLCNSSRSAIQGEDDTSIMPLFLSGRSVEREQLDRAIQLLGANVDGILITHGIIYTPKSHILARLQRIYDHIIKGDIGLGQ